MAPPGVWLVVRDTACHSSGTGSDLIQSHTALMFVPLHTQNSSRVSSTASRGHQLAGPIPMPQEFIGLQVDLPRMETSPFSELFPQAVFRAASSSVGHAAQQRPVRSRTARPRPGR